MNITDLDLAILKGITSNKKNAIEFISSSETKIFSSDAWKFADLVVSYVKAYKELPTQRVVEEQLAKGNNKATIEYCNNLWGKIKDFKYEDREFPFDLEKLKNKYAEKQVLQFRDNLVNTSIDKIDINKSVADMQKVFQNIKSVKEQKTYESHTVKDYIPIFKDRFLAKRNNPTVESGLNTGFTLFDDATNGVKGADFILITAESGFGKSTWLLNAAKGIWLQGNDPLSDSKVYKKGHNIAYFSLEMPFENCFNRLLSSLTGVAYKKIEKPSLINKEEAQLIKKALDFINNYPHSFEIIDMPNANANDIDAVLDNMDFDAVFVDYLGIMTTNEKVSDDQDWLKQGVISYELRAIARLRNIPLFSAVQLNRKAGKDSEDAIGLHRLARSAQIATHATCVVQIESRKLEENFPDLNYWLIKNRNGPKNIKGRLLKNLAAASLVDLPDSKIEEEFGFTNYIEDIEEKLEEIEI